MATNKPTASECVGQIFGDLKLLSDKSVRYPNPDSKRWMHRFLCVACDKETFQPFYAVCVQRRVVSCGCKHRQNCADGRATHGLLRHGEMPSEYRAFHNARNRCTNPKTAFYKDYGGRGIEFRFNSFQEFIDHIGFKPSPRHSIDRIDNDGHYEAGNVRWATPSQQAHNHRKNKFITIDGTTRVQSEWAAIAGIADRTISDRLRKGYCVRCAVFAPVQFRHGKPCGHDNPPENRVWRLK
jgi:hypothetical protein